MNKKPLSFIEISKNALLQNISELKKLLAPHQTIAAVVKGNAYGHGQNEVISIIKNVVDYLQVDDIQELKLLRKISDKPTFVFGYVAKHELQDALKMNATMCIYDIERLRMINDIGHRLHKVVPVHIKIDAHLGRQGLFTKDLPGFLQECKTLKNIYIDGIYSHFANIEDTYDPSHALIQIKNFDDAVSICKQYGLTAIKTHMSATSGIMAHALTKKYDIVRIGLGMYGMWPSQVLKSSLESTINLKPIARWISHIAQIKTVPKDYTIGYGLTYTTVQPTTIAIIPQGYSDGYSRLLSNNAAALINDQRCPVLGRVAMNMFVVDVSHLEHVKQEDEVVLLGRQKKELITAKELADRCQTINYEITTSISPLLKRIII